jgi:hypothetical protein
MGMDLTKYYLKKDSSASYQVQIHPEDVSLYDDIHYTPKDEALDRIWEENGKIELLLSGDDTYIYKLSPETIGYRARILEILDMPEYYNDDDLELIDELSKLHDVYSSGIEADAVNTDNIVLFVKDMPKEDLRPVATIPGKLKESNYIRKPFRQDDFDGSATREDGVTVIQVGNFGGVIQEDYETIQGIMSKAYGEDSYRVFMW